MATHTRTVVFTDIADYTASVGRTDREGLRNLIAAHEQAVAPVLERHGGRVVKNLGDSFMALFPSATDAVRSGIDLVEQVNGGGSFTMRVAMATGDVEEIDLDAFGEAVNLASRILAKAPAGEVWFSPGTQVCMNQAEIPWESVGRFALKGISGEVEIFRAIPESHCWLPAPLAHAARLGRLCRVRRGEPLPSLPPDPVILLEGFVPGTDALRQFVDHLPIVDPARLWLATYNIAPSDRLAWEQAGHGLVIGTPQAVSDAITAERSPAAHTTGSDTIILDVGGAAVLEIALGGIALPAVPMSQVVAAYTYDLLADGRWVNKSDNAVLRIEVDGTGVKATALVPGILVGGRQLVAGRADFLQDGDVIRAPGGSITFRAVDDASYIGCLVAETAARLGVAPGQTAQIGREPQHPGLALPDRRGQDNIRWCMGSRAAKARESGFTLDRALAGRKQASVVLGPSGATLLSMHERCPTFVLSGHGLERVTGPRPIGPGDTIITGTSIVTVREPTG